MKKLKVMTVLGTRPEIIRLSRIIPMLEKFTDHTLVHTGQNYDFELNEIFFSDLSLAKLAFKTLLDPNFYYIVSSLCKHK
jgi:UDP-N-acetylglucosamine 2-epimerase (non-hydrolysing)